MVTRAEIERELRQQMPGTFDYQPEGVKASLVATRLRELGVTETAAPESTAPRPLRFGNRQISQPVDNPTTDPKQLRQRLAEAIKRRDDLRHHVATASQFTGEADARLAQCQSELASFDGLDERIAEFDVNALRSGKPDHLPPELAAAKRQRSQCQDRYDRAVALQRRVAQEHQTLEDKLPDAAAVVTQAANAIAVSEARKLMRDLEDALANVNSLRSKIVALQLPGAAVPNDIIQKAFADLPKPKPDADDKAHWADFLHRLANDPNAELDA